MTSEERKEVAARLRKYAKTVTHSPEYLWTHLEIAVNGWHMRASVDKSYVSDNEVLLRLADLIDPTCHKAIPIEMGYVFCSNCGAEIGEYGVPNYCHNCGCRVTEKEGE